jgi:Cytochrome c554 and c-prime
MSSDRHSRAFQVLYDERSKNIERNLAKSEGRFTKAHEDARCLVCHTTPRPASELTATAWLNADGVGCESCHGASERWIGPHTTGSWEIKDRLQKEKEGLRDTKTLSSRAAICAGCHVGEHSADGLTVRDVNHDLIAAGHPRLNFEFSAFLDNMPAHWDEKDENADASNPGRRATEFPARAWAVGRLATINAVLALLGSRVAEKEAPPAALVGQDSASLKRTPRWPEFSEFGCFSCHHDLGDQSWRRGPRKSGTRVGSLPWGTWVLPGAEELVGELAAKADGQELIKALDAVAVAMETSAALPQIAEAVHAASGPLDKCLASAAIKSLDAATIEKLIDRVNSDEAWNHVTGWDEAAQRYLALVPLYQSWLALTENANPKQLALHKRLESLLVRLKFPDGLDSPRSFEAEKLKSQE